MTNKKWHVIGLMSGTSLDGVDLAYVKFTFDQAYDFVILEKESIKYSELWKKKLQDAFSFSGEKLTKLSADYGKFLGELVLDFIGKYDIKNPDFVASHGHTIFHRPEQGYTLQIGNGASLSAASGCKVICDFRTQDIALGGQGAPLVPIGDQLLFQDYDFCLNLGGFANISYQKKGQRLAFDIGPANIVLNHYTRQIGLEYDDKGMMASGGNLHKGLLKALDALPFYTLKQPKSLGYEFVVETILPLIDRFGLKAEDILRTFTEHIAGQIAMVINRVALSGKKTDQKTLVTGGGAFNDFLIQRIAAFSASEMVIPSDEIIEFKESLIFAFLGLLRDRNEMNCLSSVTGASKDHSSGIIYNV